MLKRIGLLIIGLICLAMSASPALAQEPITPQHTDPVWGAWYWNNTTLSGPPVLQRSEANLDFDWGGGSPDPAISADRLSYSRFGFLGACFASAYAVISGSATVESR